MGEKVDALEKSSGGEGRGGELKGKEEGEVSG